MRPLFPRLRKISFKIGSVSSKGGHSKLTRTRTWTGKGLEVALGFLENAVGSIFTRAGVIASKIPKSSRSVTLNKKTLDPGTRGPCRR